MNNTMPAIINGDDMPDSFIPTSFTQGSLSKLLQNLDRLKPQFLPLPDHFAKNCDAHTKERYATLLAAIIMADGKVAEKEVRLFYLLLGSLGLDKMPTVFFEQAHVLNLESLGDFFRAAKEANLSNIFILDSFLLSRIDGPMSEAAATILGEIAEILSMVPNELSDLSILACHILGIPTNIAIPSCSDHTSYLMWRQFLPHTLTEGPFDFIYVPPGTFMMGSPEGEKFRDSGEKQHQVTLSKGFYMQTTPVTQAQWRTVMDDNPFLNNSLEDNRPVGNVSWTSIQNFLKKLNSDGKPKYRLPTEAEWEYACRAGSTDALYGDIDDIAWYSNNSNSKTQPVAHKQPNAWGLYDMLGNVKEWCADERRDYSSASIVDPIYPISDYETYMVLRGGGFNENASYCRAAKRDFSKRHNTYDHYGVRVVRDK